MKNKKMWSWGMAVLLLAFSMVLLGCSSKPTVYNKFVPLEQSCTITIQTGVARFDGVAPRPAWPIGKKLIIPAGSHSFVLRDVVNISATAYYSSPDIPITYEFLPGHTYIIGMHFDRANRTFAARIIDEAE